MFHYKKLLTVLAFVLFSVNSWSHGLIEKIECVSPDQDLQFLGFEVESGAEDQLHFFINSKTLGEKDLGVATFTLEDVFLNNQIVEKIGITFDGGSAELLIPEVYEHSERTGTGVLNLSSPEVNQVLECLVVYELD